jgi:hypothetical protein
VLELTGGVLLDDIDVQLPLVLQPGEGQVAGADEGDERADRVGPLEQVELGVEGVVEEEPHAHGTGAELAGELAEGGLCLLGRHAALELGAEVGQGSLHELGPGWAVEDVGARQHRLGAAGRIGRALEHADEDATTAPFTTGEVLDAGGERLPAAEPQVADAEVGADGLAEQFLQPGEQGVLDVVVDGRHGAFPGLPSGVRYSTSAR